MGGEGFALEAATTFLLEKYPNHRMHEDVDGRRTLWTDKTAQGRWWTTHPFACPLSNFPICMLPYPPFRLRSRRISLGSKYVDGKILALHFVCTGTFAIPGHELGPHDMASLDEYVRKCGHQYRPGVAFELAEKIVEGSSVTEVEKAKEDLTKFGTAARSQLTRLMK